MHSFPSHIWGVYLVYITYICIYECIYRKLKKSITIIAFAYELEAPTRKCMLKGTLTCFKNKNIHIKLLAKTLMQTQLKAVLLNKNKSERA